MGVGAKRKVRFAVLWGLEKKCDDKKIRTAADVQSQCCDDDDDEMFCAGCDENLEKQNTCAEKGSTNHIDPNTD